MGGYYGGVLARHGEDVSLIARGAHREAIERDGLNVSSHWGDFTVRPQATPDPAEVGPVDLIIYSVKLYQNPEALPLIQRMLKDDTAVLTIQNGVNSADWIAEKYGWEHVVAGATYIEAGRPGPGRIVQTGSTAMIAYGEQDGSRTPRIERIWQALDKEGIQQEVATDIRSTLWTKLVNVAAVGTVMTASRASFVEVLQCPVGEYTTRCVMEEIEAVARAQGVSLAPDVVDQKLRNSVAEAEETQASLQADFNAGNPLELDYLLGAVVKQGRELDVPVPASAALYTALYKFKDGQK